MSDQELYAIARKRVNQRQRRWTLWSINLLGLIFSLGALIFFGDTLYVEYFAALFMAWMGAFAFHSIMLWMAESRAQNIEREVAKLRNGLVEEKPKRLGLSDDGELVELEADQREPLRQSR